MEVKGFNISHFRIFDEVAFNPGKGINIITGKNGSGKTSLLEAIYLLGKGRSFRHKEAGPFIKDSYQSCILTAKLISDTNNQHILGLSRSARGMKAKLDGDEVKKRSTLLQTLPLQLVTPQSHELIDKAPEYRRRFLDQGLFHVEHNSYKTLNKYHKVLRQRNAALKQGNLLLCRSFNASMITEAQVIQEKRQVLVKALKQEIIKLIDEMGLDLEFDMQLNAGWDTSKDLFQVISECEETDMTRGFTTKGAHRADIVIKSADTIAAKRFSRGQQKLLVYLLHIAQLNLIIKKGRETPVFLLDDLTAELDKENLEKILFKLDALNTQILITAVDVSSDVLPKRVNMFHVEHSSLHEVQA